MQHPRYKSKVYAKHFTPEKSDWLRENCLKFSDRQSAIRLGIPMDIVLGYRIDVLKIIKQRTREIDSTYRNCKMLARLELHALENYRYEGVMFESVKHRINALKNILG